MPKTQLICSHCGQPSVVIYAPLQWDYDSQKLVRLNDDDTEIENPEADTYCNTCEKDKPWIEVVSVSLMEDE